MDTGLFVLKALGMAIVYFATALIAWGVGGAIVVFLIFIIVKKVGKSLFITSLMAYLTLYRAGFSISRHEYFDDYHMHRFFWQGKMIRSLPDISRVGDDWVMLQDGHSELLSESKKDRDDFSLRKWWGV